MKLKYNYSMDKTLVTLFIKAAEKYPDHIIYKYRKGNSGFNEIKYNDFYKKVINFAGGLAILGLEKKRLFIISENCPEWMITVLANMGMGGVDVPRGPKSSTQELQYIIDHAEPDYIVLQNKECLELFNKLKSDKNIIRIIFDMSGITEDKSNISFETLCDEGKIHADKNPGFFEKNAHDVKPDDPATIIYTSGTTGEPKGVMLSHKNLVYAPTEVPRLVKAYDDDRWMSILPVWHVGERFFEFMGIINGVTIILSSIFNLRKDMMEEKPHIIPGVPLVWKKIMTGIKKGIGESGKGNVFDFFYRLSLNYIRARRILKNQAVRYKRLNISTFIFSIFSFIINLPFHSLAYNLIYKKIIKATGGQLRTITSGSGRLPEEVDDFFEILGIQVVDGYGATETSVLVTLRSEKSSKNTIGKIMDRTSYKILDKDTLEPCKTGQPGIIFVKGDEVFSGYYKNEKATDAVLDKNGWYNTGDLVKETITHDLVFVGRAKDTIVMLNGENVEPEPIEETLENSSYIKHAVVYGQDREELSCLIVPDLDKIKEEFKITEILKDKLETILSSHDIRAVFKSEIKRKVNLQTGFQHHEQIKNFTLLPADFEAGFELTNTMKKRRSFIFEKYKQIII